MCDKTVDTCPFVFIMFLIDARFKKWDIDLTCIASIS